MHRNLRWSASTRRGQVQALTHKIVARALARVVRARGFKVAVDAGPDVEGLRDHAARVFEMYAPPAQDGHDARPERHGRADRLQL
jgi:GTP cyclohydrolase I